MRRSVVFVAVAVAAGVLPGSTGSAAACGRDTAARSGTWFHAQPPRQTRGAVRTATWGPVNGYLASGIDPADARVVYVTDGTYVQRSEDGGCTWRVVWAIPSLAEPLGPDDMAATITSLDVAHVAGRSRVLLTVLRSAHEFAVPAIIQVVRSDDGRTGWEVVHESVSVGGNGGPQVRSGGGGVAYAIVRTPAGAAAYARSPDGTSWELRTPATTAERATGVAGFAPSPWNPDEVWEWFGSTLRRSLDGARTWQEVDPFPGQSDKPTWNLADVAWPRRDRPARIVVLGGDSNETVYDPAPVLQWSGDGGASWGSLVPPTHMPLALSFLSHTASGDLLLLSPASIGYRVPHTGRLPRPSAWRKLPKMRVPLSGAERFFLDPNLAHTTVTSPPVFLVPSYEYLHLLTLR